MTSSGSSGRDMEGLGELFAPVCLGPNQVTIFSNRVIGAGKSTRWYSLHRPLGIRKGDNGLISVRIQSACTFPSELTVILPQVQRLVTR